MNERREHVQKFRLCFNCLRPGHLSKDCSSITCSVANCGQRHNKFLYRDLKKEATTGASDATTALATNITQGRLPVVRIELVNGDLSLSVQAMCDTRSSIAFGGNRVYPAAARPKSAYVSSRNPRITRCQDGNSADSCFSAREVSTIDDNAILLSWENEVGWPDCRSARVERSLPTSNEFAKIELQSKRSSSSSWPRLLRHPSPVKI